MANFFSSEAPRSFFPSSAVILLVVRSANDDCMCSPGQFQGQFTIIDIYRCDSATIDNVILRTSRARCALNKEILNVESILERAVVELVYKFNEWSTTSV